MTRVTPPRAGQQSAPAPPAAVVTAAAPPGRSARPVRVLHVYAGNLYGGVERMLVTMQRHRDCSPGVEADYALCFPGRLHDELAAARAVIHRLGEARLGRPWTVWRARRRLTDVIATAGYDVCVTHSGWLNALFGPVIHKAGARWLYWVHGPTDERWYERAMRKRLPDAVVTNSRFTLEALRSGGTAYAALPATAIYCPVEASPPADHERVRTEVRAAIGCPAGRVVVACTARMEPWKGHRLLIDALGRIGGALDWECWIVGGPQRPHERAYLADLAERVARGGIAHRVRFLGQRADVHDLLAAADVHCQPNTGPEPFGIAFVEAMHAGLPVVTARLGAAVEIVGHGETGLLVPPEDPGALAAALQSLFADPETRRRLGIAGRRRAADLCDPAMRLRDFAAVVTELCVGSPKRAEVPA